MTIRAKVSLIVLAAFALCVFLAYRVIIAGLTYNAVVGIYSQFFTEIVGRAIQLEQLGQMGWVPNGFGTPLPDDMQRAREYLNELWDKQTVFEIFFGSTGNDFDCSADIQLKPVSAREVWPALGTMLSYDPFRYVVVFAGDPADIAPFLDETRNTDLIGPLAPFDTPPGKANDLAMRDMTGRFVAIQTRFPNGISWKPVKCGKFSYIGFREK